MSVNKVILVGNLGADPDVRKFDGGGMIVNISVATSERWNDRQTGERKEHTEWHRVTLNNRLAEIAQQYLRKGSKVYVEGSLRTRKWTDQNGQERYVTEIRAETFQMLDSRNNDGYQNNSPYPAGQGGYQNAPQAYDNYGYNPQAQNQGGYQQPAHQNQFANQSYPSNQGFAPQQGGYPQASNQNNMAQNNSFGMPAPQPVPAPKPSIPASEPVITPAQANSIADDDIPF